jgi:hypothetical protein
MKDNPSIRGGCMAAISIFGAHSVIGDAWIWTYPEDNLKDDLFPFGVEPPQVVEA